jgi:hypothetical protein
MKIHIVFEIDTLPDVGLGDVAAVVQQASTTFKAAVSPLGKCGLLQIKSADLGTSVSRQESRPRE